MIDIRRLRADPDEVKFALRRRGFDPSQVDRVLALDQRQRTAGAKRDELRATVRRLSDEVRRARQANDIAAADEAARQSKALGEEEKALDGEARAVAADVRDLLLQIPNVPSPDCPDGLTADDNVVLRVEGPGLEGFEPHQRLPHWEVGAELGLLDLERGAKLSGSMFPAFRGMGATLVRALVQYGLDLNRDAFEEVRPPTLVRTETMTATGHLPKFADEAYSVERDGLWAIPTAEVPLTSMYRDEILDEDALPMRLMAYTSCFRREAGAAGRDTRGLLRVHEFDKVEILAYVTPEQAPGMHAELLLRAEAPLRGLGLTYRVLDLCAGELGHAAARCFDLEVYAPGVDQWLEVSSVSWFTDYQARRANIRYRPHGRGGGPQVLHTLNGSALAVPRVWAALVESYRQADGSIAAPAALLPYLGGATTIR